MKRCLKGVDAVLHTATLHKPHIITQGRQDFVDVNVTGTLNLLEEAVSDGVQSFVFTSTTSIDRVYVNEKAQRELGWKPRYNFDYVLRRLQSNEEFRSALSITVGSKGYQTEKSADGPYPVK